jgi:mannosidase alpha-like ER degradation enhancer 3
VKGRVAVADPLRVCGDVLNPEHVRGRIAIVERGDCMFVEKVRVQYLCIVLTALIIIASKCSLISGAPFPLC